MDSRKAEQDRWLAEAARLLAEAERFTGMLALATGRRDLTLVVVQSEIMGLRREIDRVQRERAGERRREFDPKWMDSAWSAGR